MNQLTVIKIGGNILDDASRLSSFLDDFAKLDGYKILVHGGGKLATSFGFKLGIEPNYVNGRRITDEATLELVTMVYAGLINKNIIAQLQSRNCNAIGLTGADGNIIPAIKRPVKEVDFGFVGDVIEGTLNINVLKALLDAGLTPVLAPLTHDSKGNLLNTNADTIAQEIAKSFATIFNVQLIYSFEKKGVLRDSNDETTVIKSINPTQFEQLKADKIIFEGMIPKLENAFTAIKSGVSKVIIGQAEELPLLIAGTSGTQIIAS